MLRGEVEEVALGLGDRKLYYMNINGCHLWEHKDTFYIARPWLALLTGDIPMLFVIAAHLHRYLLTCRIDLLRINHTVQTLVTCYNED